MDDGRIDFWVDFLEADMIERQEMIKNLPALQEFKKSLIKEDSELVAIAFDTIMFSLFDDLADTAFVHYTKDEEPPC